MEKKKQNLIAFAILAVLLLVFGVLLIRNSIYNKTEKVGSLDAEHFDGEVYQFDDISVALTIRGGDSGAWMKDPIYDDDGNMLHGSSVGTIYEAVVSNKTKNLVSDWKLKIPINEMMWINNNWDSEMEIHQHVGGDEKVLAIDLSDYSEYDINLDYYIDHTGPMIPLDKGDYFIYLPEQIAKEIPIQPNLTGVVGEGSVRFGYIMYIPDQTLDYVADFSGGEIEYYMYCNPISQPWFWILVSLIFIWLVSFIVTLILRYKMKSMLEQKKKEKKHTEKMIKQTMQIIINMIESKDMNTKGHSLRVAEYSKKIAKRMGYDSDAAQEVYYVGLMHDCGKVNIPNAILKNPGKLSKDEYEEMKKHTTYGGDVLKDFTSVKDIDVGAKYHHERYDGKGYPAGLKGDEIPQIARIICVADAFDAMNSKRCYRDKLPSDIVLDELRNNKGKQFDPAIVDHMLALIEEGEIAL